MAKLDLGEIVFKLSSIPLIAGSFVLGYELARAVNERTDVDDWARFSASLLVTAGLLYYKTKNIPKYNPNPYKI